MINHQFHRHNRASLLSSMDVDSVAVLSAAPQLIRNGDVFHSYRQNSNFYYLSGFPEPESILVLDKRSGQEQSFLFCRTRDPSKEMWDGEIIGPERAQQEWGFDQAWDIEQFSTQIRSLLTDKTKLYMSEKTNAWLVEHIERTNIQLERLSIDFLLSELRLIKSAEEIKCLQQAARITGKGFEQVMSVLSPGMYEYQIEAELIRSYRAHNATCAYPNIVAGGNRALVLHYHRNDRLLNDGDLLLIDSGAEYNCYASDVSRTLPVNGRFTPEQRLIYDIVLTAQRAAIKLATAGRSWIDSHDQAVRVLVEGLIDVGLVRENLEDSLQSKSYQRFYPHRTSHWMGLDVHDVGEYRVGDDWRELEAGMVFTVEPGLYIPDHPDIAPQFRGIGVRIEDDVLVQKNKPARILTSGIPSDAQEIEYAMRHQRASNVGTGASMAPVTGKSTLVAGGG